MLEGLVNAFGVMYEVLVGDGNAFGSSGGTRGVLQEGQSLLGNVRFAPVFGCTQIEAIGHQPL